MNKYKYIINPKSSIKVNINSKLGRQILNNYLQLGGHKGPCGLNVDGTRCKKSKTWDNTNCELSDRGNCKKKVKDLYNELWAKQDNYSVKITPSVLKKRREMIDEIFDIYNTYKEINSKIKHPNDWAYPPQYCYDQQLINNLKDFRKAFNNELTSVDSDECIEVTTANGFPINTVIKYQNRNKPPYDANKCTIGMTMTGNNGIKYIVNSKNTWDEIKPISKHTVQVRGGAVSAPPGASPLAISTNIKAIWEWDYDELDDDFKMDYLLPVLKYETFPIPKYETYLYPPKILVSNLHTNINGEYKYTTRGSGGMIYENYDTDEQILKITKYNHNEMEVLLQTKAGKYAPEIYHTELINKLPNQYTKLTNEDINTYLHDLPDNVDVNKVQKVISELTTNQNQPVFVIIMENLSLPSWIPLRKLLKEPKISFYADILQKNVIDLVTKCKIYNCDDFVGYTGDHIFFNRELNQFKFIDYGFFREIKETDDEESIIKKMLEDVSDQYPKLKFNFVSMI